MLWAQRSTRTFLEELMNHKVWECKHAEFKITYVHSVSLQSSLIKLGNELQQRMQDRRLRGHEHRHMSNNDIRVLWCKKSLFPQYWLMDQTYTKKELKLLIEKLIFWTFWLDNEQVPTFIFTLWMWLTEWWREKLCVLTFTHWKFITVYRPLAWTMAVFPTLVCLCEWYREIHYSY